MMEIMLASLFIFACSFNTPVDMNAILGAVVGGFLLGMFMFGEDGQGVSQAFLGIAVVGFLVMMGASGYHLHKNTAEVKKNEIAKISGLLDG